MEDGSKFVETTLVEGADGAVQVLAVGAKLGLMSSFLGDILDLATDDKLDQNDPKKRQSAVKRAVNTLS